VETVVTLWGCGRCAFCPQHIELLNQLLISTRGILADVGAKVPAEPRRPTATAEPSYAVSVVDDDYARLSAFTLRIVRNGELIAEHYDRGEPEDVSFHRDWDWVAPALRQAYAFGVEDASRRERAPKTPRGDGTTAAKCANCGHAQEHHIINGTGCGADCECESYE
jgi:hypothetical protein